MTIQISRAEAWTRAHEVFTRVNFNAFDYNSIKESLLDYVKLYFPEDFNDYIESSEFIAILEMFAYVGEMLSYRLDMNAHENFITTAERKESILRLAKLISYKASRNIAARGLVKLTSIQTTEQIIDSQGKNIANTKILWNDLNNSNWKDQFLAIMNRVLEQDFGSIAPNERVQIEDVLFELYSFNNLPLKGNGITVFDYSALSAGQTFPMELVPVQLTATSPIEQRPERKSKFSLLYGSDGLGDSSDTTGFFMFTKQGNLRLQEQHFDGVTPNQTLKIDNININETDVWMNNVDPNTRALLASDPYTELLPHLVDSAKRYGEWSEVNLSSAQNIIFNTNDNRQQYETETLSSDKVNIVFGDGEFSDIPSGDFDIWFRTSANSNSIIQKTSVVDQTATFTYLDLTNTVQTIKFTFSLINSLQNASKSEDIEHVRRVAPSVYYTQDRMVNGRDYNSFMLQDPTILKLQAVNRTFAGDSKYIAWHDPKEYYEDVKIFSDDLALYWYEEDIDNGGLAAPGNPASPNVLIANYIEPLICSAGFYVIMAEEFNKAGTDISNLSCTFTDPEIVSITAALTQAATSQNPQVDLWYSATSQEWTVDNHTVHPSLHMIRVEAQFLASSHSDWTVRWITKRMNAQSDSTKFRHTNTTDKVINNNTLSSNDDVIKVLSANTNGDQTGILAASLPYNILAQELIEQNLPNAGVPDGNRLSVVPADTDDNGIPDDLIQAELMLATSTVVYNNATHAGTIDLSSAQYYMDGTEAEMDNDITVTWSVLEGSPLTTVTKTGTFNTSAPVEIQLIKGAVTNGIINTVSFNGDAIPPDNTIITIATKHYVYFKRESLTSLWVPKPASDANKTLWHGNLDNTWKRAHGRYPLNFAWFYTTPRFHLVDPAASNIIDMFIITVGYYQGMTRWLENKTSVVPTAPTPLDLRTSYNGLLQNSMISDTVVLQAGLFKILFGSRAIPELQSVFKVIRPTIANLTDNEVKVKIVEIVQAYFNINNWDFGSTFYFTELAASIHAVLGSEINSIVLVPSYSTNQFGDMFQVQSQENEIFVPDISTSNIEVIQSFTPENIRQ